MTSSLESAARMQRVWQVPAYHDIDEFLSTDLEAVIIASPNDLHATQALRVLASGRHVLIEKPMALTLADADAIVAAAAASSRVVAVGHEMRGFDLFVKIQRTLQSGRLGEPLQLAINLWRRPYRPGIGGWKRDPARLGSTILEEPIHYLDLARWLMGEPTEVLAWSSSLNPEAVTHDNLDVRLRFAGSGPAPRWALISRSLAAAGYHVEVRLVGSEASMCGYWHGKQDTDLSPRVDLVMHAPNGDERLAISRASGHAYDLVRQTYAFVNAIRHGEPVMATAADGRAAVALSLAVEASLNSGAPVTLKSAN
jgi:myo-inositol 2-dehydrogenase/D-chiro-inositol 1-dehydrogenase